MATYRAPHFFAITRRLSSHPDGSPGLSTPATRPPTATRAVTAMPPMMARHGRCGSTSRPPGAPATKAVVSLRRLKAWASTRSFFVATGSCLSCWVLGRRTPYGAASPRGARSVPPTVCRGQPPAGRQHQGAGEQQHPGQGGRRADGGARAGQDRRGGRGRVRRRGDGAGGLRRAGGVGVRASAEETAVAPADGALDGDRPGAERARRDAAPAALAAALAAAAVVAAGVVAAAVPGPTTGVAGSTGRSVAG